MTCWNLLSNYGDFTKKNPLKFGYFHAFFSQNSFEQVACDFFLSPNANNLAQKRGKKENHKMLLLSFHESI